MWLNVPWHVVVPGASREAIERLLGFAKDNRLGVIGSGLSSRTSYDRVYLASTYRLMARLLSAILREQGAEMEVVDRFELAGVIEELVERADEVRESAVPIVGDYDFRLGFAPVLSAPSESVWWSMSIAGLDQEGASRIVRFAESVGIRAWEVDPELLIAPIRSIRDVEERLGWLSRGRELCAFALSAHEEEVADALLTDMRFWLATATATESGEFVVRYDD